MADEKHYQMRRGPKQFQRFICVLFVAWPLENNLLAIL